jgi:hypothetical protein
MQRLRLLALILPLLALVVAPAARADELIDSGWVTLAPAELGKPYEGERIIFKGVEVFERGAIQTDALAVVKMILTVESKVDYDLYFDMDVVARDAEGQILFTLTLGPDVLGLWPKSETEISQTRYVVPGTLEKVASYDVRFLGFR